VENDFKLQPRFDAQHLEKLKEKFMKKTLIYFVSLLIMSGNLFAQPPAQPVMKNGSCPSGYVSSGNYCVPSGDSSRFAITKSGSCPSGYVSSGDYCLASGDNSRLAIPKQGSCPSGYISSGDYCLSSK
jgi:hypothetical protein